MGEVIPFPFRATRPAPQQVEPAARTDAKSRGEVLPVSQSAPASRPQPVSQPCPVPRPAPAAQPTPGRHLGTPEPLWRTVLGDELRAVRAGRGERIADVAERAGMSPQYLSEIERGRKDPSSEMLAAVAGSLGLTVRELSQRIAQRFDAAVMMPRAGSRLSTLTVPPATRPTGPLCMAA